MTGLLSALLLVAVPFGALVAAPGPPAVHYRARYRGGDGVWHLVEVWRDGQTRLRRRTDDRLEIHAARAEPGAAPRLVVLDLARRAAYGASPAELLQAGLLTDWNELAHSLSRPRPGQRLRPLRRSARTALGRCQLYRLEQPGAPPARLCWSPAWQLPLYIEGEGAAARTRQFELDAVDGAPINPAVFEIPPDLRAQLAPGDD